MTDELLNLILKTFPNMGPTSINIQMNDAQPTVIVLGFPNTFEPIIYREQLDGSFKELK